MGVIVGNRRESIRRDANDRKFGAISWGGKLHEVDPAIPIDACLVVMTAQHQDDVRLSESVNEFVSIRDRLETQMRGDDDRRAFIQFRQVSP
ncbi:MAG: hypothetical protein N2C14_20515, partial [Planctomycetales bacterium]